MKVLPLLLSICLLLSLFTACGQSAPAQTTAAPTTAATEPAPSGPSQAAVDALEGKKILFIGNSYTYWGNAVINKTIHVTSQEERSNDKGYFYQLCKANGINVSVTNWVFGSHDFTDIASNECKCPYTECIGSNHLAPMTDPYFDYVAMQCFSESEYEGNLVAHMKPAMDFFREANPNVKFLLLVPHMAYDKGYKWTGDLQAMADEDVLVCNWGGMLYDIVNKTVQVPGATQQYFRPSFVISRSEEDGHHQNLLAGYLTVLMAYCAITGDSAVGQPYAFADDNSLHPNFDFEAFRDEYYTYEPFTNFIEIYNSEADMLGLQQLVNEYIEKYNEVN